MKQYKTLGVIIKRQNFLEADKLLTIYTKDFGKITAIAKGVRKPLSKLSGYLQLFNEVELELSKGKNIDLIISADLITRFDNIPKNKLNINCSFFIAELLYKLTQERLKSIAIYKDLVKILASISDKKIHIIYYFEQKLYQNLGLQPEVDKCVKCFSKDINRNLYFNSFEGGLICTKCSIKTFDNLKIKPDTIKLLRVIKNNDLEYLTKIIIKDDILKDLVAVNKSIRKENTDLEIKSEKYL